MSTDPVAEKQAKRFLILKTIYDMTGGQVMTRFVLKSVGEKLGLDKRDAWMEMAFLRDKGLIRFKNLSGDITRAGIEEVEAKLSHPEKPTTHFPAGNLIYVENMVGSQIQQGTVGSHQTQTNQFPDISTLQSFIVDIREALPRLEVSNEDRLLAASEAARIETQVAAPAPNFKIVRQSVDIIRDLLIGAGGSLIAVGILAKYPHIFSWITP